MILSNHLLSSKHDLFIHLIHHRYLILVSLLGKEVDFSLLSSNDIFLDDIIKWIKKYELKVTQG